MKLAIATAATLMFCSAIPSAFAQDFDPMEMADKNVDGKIDLTEASAFTTQGWGFVDQAGAGKVKKDAAPDFIQPSFAGATVDAEGFVTKEAYLAAVPARFKAADANADGSLDAAEMRKFLGM